jgi:nucleoid-associated protein YgaU
MNDPAIKLALALCILLGGLLAAIAFRPDPAVPRPEAPSWSELAALRSRRPSESTAFTVKRRTAQIAPLRSPAADSESTRGATVLAPFDNPPPVPALSAKYPGDGAASSTGWGMPIIPSPATAQSEQGPRIHKIVDGDTLPALAARYLGTPNRAMEIFKANREVLSDPDLLPIGGELKIPQ